MSLKEVLSSLKSNQALLHYNIATFEQFKAGLEAVKETKIPLIFGVSEGEEKYLGVENTRALVEVAQGSGLPVFLNADHHKSLESCQRAIDHYFDAVLFDGSELLLAENILRTNELKKYRAEKGATSILLEGEVGYLPGQSDLEGQVEIKQEHLTRIEEATQYVQTTGVDLLAISVGNVHGIPNQEINLDFERITSIKQAVQIPLVLHGGSGITPQSLQRAISAGISIIHLNTEFRALWRDSARKELSQETVVPYKLLEPVVRELTERIIYYQKLFFNNI